MLTLDMRQRAQPVQRAAIGPAKRDACSATCYNTAGTSGAGDDKSYEYMFDGNGNVGQRVDMSDDSIDALDLPVALTALRARRAEEQALAGGQALEP